MHLKTFHSPSIQDAIREARLQLGSDAMLLNSRRVSAANDPSAVFAVTFATTAPIDKEDSGRIAPPSAAQRNGTLSTDSNGSTDTKGQVSQAVGAQPSKASGSGRDAAPVTMETDRSIATGEIDATIPAPERTTATAASGTKARKTTSGRGASRRKAVGAGVAASADKLVSSSSQRAETVSATTNAAANGDMQSYGDLLEQPYPSYEKLFEQMTSMRREMLQLAGSFRRASAATYRQELSSEELKWAYDVLVSQDFNNEIIEDVIEDLTLRLATVSAESQRTKKDRRRRKDPGETNAHTENSLLDLLRDSLRSRIELRPEPSLHQRTGKPQIIALVGPPGVGKTTTLVKLAGRFGLYSRFPLQIISMDNYRVAAAEQLRTYASVLGVGFDALPSATALDKALRQYQSKELILIDTPGYGWRDFSAAEGLAALLREQEHASIHLTLSASMKPTDLSRVADLYEVFAYNSMLFTKLDETSTIGSLVSEAWTRRKPLSYICAGQRIPDDIEVASHEPILQRVLPLSLNSEEFAA